jgi:hypothetical protein
MVPYLKGFHLTIEMWRGGQDAEGWKLMNDAEEDKEELVEEELATMSHLLGKRSLDKTHGLADGWTTPVPRLRGDILALLRLASFELPPLRVVRPAQMVHVYYGFGDASGKQFGATLSEDYGCQRKLGKEVSSTRGVRF